MIACLFTSSAASPSLPPRWQFRSAESTTLLQTCQDIVDDGTGGRVVDDLPEATAKIPLEMGIACTDGGSYGVDGAEILLQEGTRELAAARSVYGGVAEEGAEALFRRLSGRRKVCRMRYLSL
jgi:hypothetical protein